MSAPRVELLVTDDCPHVEETRDRLAGVLDRLTPDVRPEVTEVSTLGEARKLSFPGSPTIRIDGRDVEGRDVPATPALACRTYEDGERLPPEWRVEAGLLRSLEPRHLLFLCVANSARSQMAEGIARQLAPDGVRISSAGSEPASVREEAVRALAEVGIDIGGQRSTGFDAIEGPVDAVITLCAEEVCPAWLEDDALRIHWPLTDPAAAAGGTEARMEAFRSVRDRLRRRIGAIFAG